MMLTQQQMHEDAELADKVVRDRCEVQLQEAVWALNRAIGEFYNAPAFNAAYYTLVSARDRVWAVGQREFGWRG